MNRIIRRGKQTFRGGEVFVNNGEHKMLFQNERRGKKVKNKNRRKIFNIVTSWVEREEIR